MLFRQAQIEDLEAIWQIILYAKETMRQRGSQQWQDGYPFRETIAQDIVHCYGYVVEEQGEVIAYMAISIIVFQLLKDVHRGIPIAVSHGRVKGTGGV